MDQNAGRNTNRAGNIRKILGGIEKQYGAEEGVLLSTAILRTITQGIEQSMDFAASGNCCDAVFQMVKRPLAFSYKAENESKRELEFEKAKREIYAFSAEKELCLYIPVRDPALMSEAGMIYKDFHDALPLDKAFAVISKSIKGLPDAEEDPSAGICGDFLLGTFYACSDTADMMAEDVLKKVSEFMQSEKGKEKIRSSEFAWETAKQKVLAFTAFSAKDESRHISKSIADLSGSIGRLCSFYNPRTTDKETALILGFLAFFSQTCAARENAWICVNEYFSA